MLNRIDTSITCINDVQISTNQLIHFTWNYILFFVVVVVTTIFYVIVIVDMNYVLVIKVTAEHSSKNKLLRFLCNFAQIMCVFVSQIMLFSFCPLLCHLIESLYVILWNTCHKRLCSDYVCVCESNNALIILHLIMSSH